MNLVRLFIAAVAAPLIVAACSRERVETYRVPREKDPEMPAVAGSATSGAAETASGAAGGGMASTPVATASGASLTWTAPDDWKPKAASAMRKGSYAIPAEGGAEADLGITAFPGDVGGELANYNRWRGQVQLGPIAEAELTGKIERVEHNGLTFGVVDIAGGGENPQRIVGAFVPFGGATWFFKIVGPDAAVAKVKPAFLEFLKTVKPAASATQ